MTCHEIIEQYLKDHGYDGLCNPEIECGCLLDDFIPCDDGYWHCEPGYKRRVDPDDNEYETDYVVGPKKPEAENDQK